MKPLKLFKSVILGSPAAGKTTIASKIVDSFFIAYISTGLRLRQQIGSNTDIGKDVGRYVNGGVLIPDEIIIKFIMNELQLLKNKAWILDGFPRTVAQCEALHEEKQVDMVINLVVPNDVLIKRVKGRWVHTPSGRNYNVDYHAPKVPKVDDVTGEALVQRKDDKPDIFKERLEKYTINSAPVIDFYRNKKVLHDYDGVTSDEIWPKVYKDLVTFIQPKEIFDNLK